MKRTVGDAPLLLVTSAPYLSRAMVSSQQEGLGPLPTPANQLVTDSSLNSWERAIPSSVWSVHSDHAGYETFSHIWQQLRGSSDESQQE